MISNLSFQTLFVLMDVLYAKKLQHKTLSDAKSTSMITHLNYFSAKNIVFFTTLIP